MTYLGWEWEYSLLRHFCHLKFNNGPGNLVIGEKAHVEKGPGPLRVALSFPSTPVQALYYNDSLTSVVRDSI